MELIALVYHHGKLPILLYLNGKIFEMKRSLDSFPNDRIANNV